MLLWLILALMTAAALAAVIVPLVRGQPPTARRAAYDVEIYRDQLAELEREAARGLIGAAEAAAARTEIARRMLATTAPDDRPPEAERPSRARELAPVMMAACLPIAAFMLYLGIGSPGLQSPSTASRPGAATTAQAQQGQEPQQHELATMVERLSQRLKDDPSDAEGWVMLARSYQTLNRHADAAEAWKRAIALNPGEPGLNGMLGETLVMAAGGMVTPEALEAFARNLTASPRDPRSRFYLGMARAQAGEHRAALQIWTDLAALSPADAPWLPALQARIRDVAAEAKLDPATIRPSAEALALARELPPAPPQPPPPQPPRAQPAPGAGPGMAAAPRGPSQADVEAAQQMTPEQRQTMIRGMVESLAARLESQPNDLEGWRRLGRAYKVLNEPDKSREAYGKAAALAPQNLDVLMEYAGTMVTGVTEDKPLPAAFVGVMRQVLAIDPAHGDALWFLGLAAAQSGDRAGARALWEKLIQRLPPGSAEHAQVKQRLDGLGATN